MPFTLAKVMEFSTRPGTLEPQVTGTHHYVRLRGGDGHEAPLYIQDGRVYGEGGDEVAASELPEWFEVEVAKCSPAALAAVGWKPSAHGDAPARDASGRWLPSRSEPRP